MPKSLTSLIAELAQLRRKRAAQRPGGPRYGRVREVCITMQGSDLAEVRSRYGTLLRHERAGQPISAAEYAQQHAAELAACGFPQQP